MGPKDLPLITCNEFCGVGAIVLLNEKRNDCGWAEEQNRLIDHTELNSILKVVMSCQFSVQHCVSEFQLLHAAGVVVGGLRQRLRKESDRERQKMSIWRSRSFNEHY